METPITATLFRPFSSNRDCFSGKLEISRYRALNFKCVAPFSDDHDILEWLFKATNAPDSLLDVEQKWILNVFRNHQLHAISVGDVIQIEESFYLCARYGWTKVDNFQETYDLD